MSKAKKGSKQNPITTEDLKNITEAISDQRTFVIKEATIKEGLCDYKYEIIKGIGLGDTHAVKGKGIVDDDLTEAFAAFHVHLAVIDGIFKYSNIEIKDIDDMKEHELTSLFHVNGFKIKGGTDEQEIVLTGFKYLPDAVGRMELVSPKIILDNLTSYKWYNELQTAVDKACREVELYKGGKCTPVEPENEKENSKQLTIDDQNTDGKKSMSELVDEEFEKGKVG